MRRRELISVAKPLPYARRVLSLNSNGSQYIDTEWHPISNNAKIEFVFTPLASLGGKAVCGSEMYDIRCRWLFTIYGQRGVSQCSPLIRDWNNHLGFNAEVGKEYRVEWVSSYGYDTYKELTTGFELSNYSDVDLRGHYQNFRIFDNANQRSSIAVKMFKIWDNDELVRNYFPVISKEGNAEMFDGVNGVFAKRIGSFGFTEITSQIDGWGGV